MPKKIFLLLAFFCFPFVAQASFCNEKAATVVYINGIFSTEEKARKDLERLKIEFQNIKKDQNIRFLNGFNPSHLGGGGDLVKAWFQNHVADGIYADDYDLKTILINLHKDLKTQKILLVGHSQGTYYTNAAYYYLIANGVPKESIGIYNIATPASYVANNGPYLNSSGDTMLTFLRNALGFSALSNNIDLVSSPDDALQAWPGHSLSQAYLAEASERIVGDISKEIAELKVHGPVSNSEGCFAPPSEGLAYFLQGTALAIGDPMALALKKGSTAAYKGAAVLARGGYFTLAKAAVLLDSVLSSRLSTEDNTIAGFTIYKTLYGSSLGEEDVKELLQGQSAAVVSAAKQKPAGIVLGAQTEVPSSDVAEPLPRARIMLSSKNNNNDEVTPAPEVSQTVGTSQETEEQIEAEHAKEIEEGESEPLPVPQPTSEPEPAPEPVPDTVAPVSQASTRLVGGHASSTVFAIDFSASDEEGGSGVAEIRLFARHYVRFAGYGGWGVIATSSNPSGTFEVVTAADSYGAFEYEYYTVAVDNAGNVEAVPNAADVTIYFDALRESVDFTLRANRTNDTAVEVEANFVGVVTQPVLARLYGNLAKSIQASDLQLVNATIVDFTPAPNDPAKYTFKLAQLFDGFFGIVFPEGITHDRAGNLSLRSELIIPSNVVPPTVTISHPATDGLVGTVEDFIMAFSVTQSPIPGTVKSELYVECGPDGQLSPCEPVSTYGLPMDIPEGSHTFTVRATDPIGNVTSVTRSFEIRKAGTAVN